MSATRRIAITPMDGEVRVVAGGHVVAHSSQALQLDEEGHRPVIYVPRADVNFARLTRSERSSHCPYKGDASYFHFSSGGKDVADIAWCYEQPLASVGEISCHLAFYADKCEVTYQPA